MPPDPLDRHVVNDVLWGHRERSTAICDELARALDGATLRGVALDEERGSLQLVTSTIAVRLAVSNLPASRRITDMHRRGPVRLAASARNGSLVITAAGGFLSVTLRCLPAHVTV